MTIHRRVSIRTSLSVAGFCVVILSSAAAQATCGDANSDGTINTADALYTLKASVGQVSCGSGDCDVDASGRITTTDALRVLKTATGQDLDLTCVNTSAEPEDPGYSQQWGLPAIHAPEVWGTQKDCSGLIIGVVDSGTDFYHDDLVDNLWHNPGEIPFNRKDDDGNGFIDDVYGWDFVKGDEFPWDVNGHGTHVAGIIGATANTQGTVGVCWKARIMTLRFLDDNGQGFSSDAIQAIDYARRMGARVINNSWGGGAYSNGESESFRDAENAGITMVVAAGNDASNIDVVPEYPSDYLHIAQVNVAATDESGALASFSNYGSKNVHVAAPGDQILSTLPYDTYGLLSGTSMAAPMVTGAVALLRSHFPSLDVLTIKNILMESSTPEAGLAGLVHSGGLLNIEAAFAAAEVSGAAALLRSGADDAAAPAPPGLRARRDLDSFNEPGRKYPHLKHAVETYSNGKSRAVTMVADHVVVRLDDEAAVAALEARGFEVLRRLQTDPPSVLVGAPVSIDDTESKLKDVPGVRSVDPDYLVTAR